MNDQGDDSVDLLIAARTGVHVARSLYAGLGACVSLTAATVAFTRTLAFYPEDLNGNLPVVLAALSALGAGMAFLSYRTMHQGLLRWQYGVHETDLMMSNRKQDWTPLMSLDDLETVRVDSRDTFIDDSRYVHLLRDGKWTSIGPFEGAESWATRVVSRASDVQGREVSLQEE